MSTWHASALREFGHDVLTSLDAGKASDAIPDEEVLRYATADQRALITHNRQDFIHLHRLHPEHDGIIVCTVDTDFPTLTAEGCRFINNLVIKEYLAEFHDAQPA